jgi:hypothetical protein
VGASMIAKREHRLPLVEQGFELAAISRLRIDALGVRTNLNSLPAEVGKTAFLVDWGLGLFQIGDFDASGEPVI